MTIVREIGTMSMKQCKTKLGAKLFIKKMKKYGQIWEIYWEPIPTKFKTWPQKRGGMRA